MLPPAPSALQVKSFRQIQDEKNSALNPFFQGMDLEQYARLANAVTDSNLYEAAAGGGVDNFIKGVSAGIDRGIEGVAAPVIPSIDKGLDAVFEFFGRERRPDQDVGGAGLLRAGVNYAPLALGLAGPVGAAVGLGGAALMNALDAYEKTDSPMSAGIAGGATALAPGVGKVMGQAALKAGGSVAGRLAAKTGGTLGSNVFGQTMVDGARVATTVGERALHFAGSEVGAEGLFQVASAAADAATGGEFWRHFTDPNQLLNTALEELPFSIFDLAHTVKPTPQVALEARARLASRFVESADRLDPAVTRAEVATPAGLEGVSADASPASSTSGVEERKNMIEAQVFDSIAHLQQTMDEVDADTTLQEGEKALVKGEWQKRFESYNNFLTKFRSQLETDERLMGVPLNDVMEKARVKARLNVDVDLEALMEQHVEQHPEDFADLYEHFRTHNALVEEAGADELMVDDEEIRTDVEGLDEINGDLGASVGDVVAGKNESLRKLVEERRAVLNGTSDFRKLVKDRRRELKAKKIAETPLEGGVPGDETGDVVDSEVDVNDEPNPVDRDMPDVEQDGPRVEAASQMAAGSGVDDVIGSQVALEDLHAKLLRDAEETGLGLETLDKAAFKRLVQSNPTEAAKYVKDKHLELAGRLVANARAREADQVNQIAEKLKLELVDTPDMKATTKAGGVGNKILVNRERLRQTYDAKVWADPQHQTPLPEDTFTDFGTYVAWMLKRSEIGGQGIFSQSATKQNEIAKAAFEALGLRVPKELDPEGTGEGATQYNAAQLGGQSKLQGYQLDEMGADFDGLVDRLLVRYGMRVKEREAFRGALQRVKGLVKTDDVQWGELVKTGFTGEGEIVGLSQATKDAVRKVFLGNLNRVAGLEGKELERFQMFVLAHELGHSLDQVKRGDGFAPKESKLFEDLIEWSKLSGREERVETMRVAMEMWMPKEFHGSAHVKELIENVDSPEELRANLFAAWAMGASHKEGDTAFGWAFLPAPVRQVFQYVVRQMRKLSGAMRSAFKLGGVPNELVGKKLDTFKELFEGLNKEVMEGQKVVDEFMGLAQMGPHQMLTPSQTEVRQEKGLEGASDVFEFATLRGKDNNILDRALRMASRLIERPEQFAKRYPEFRGAVGTMFGHSERMRASQMKQFAPIIGGLTASGNVKKTEQFQKHLEVTQGQNPTNNRAFSAVAQAMQSSEAFVNPDELDGAIAQMQLKKVNGGGKLSAPDSIKLKDLERAKDAWARVKPEGKALIKEQLAAHSESIKLNQQESLEVRDAEGQYMVARFLAQKLQNTNVTHEEALIMANDIYDMMNARMSGDPQRAELGEIRQRFTLERFNQLGHTKAFEKALQSAAKLISNRKKLEDFYAKRPWFYSEHQYGKYRLSFTDADGVEKKLTFQQRASRQSKQKQLEAAGATNFRQQDVERDGLYTELDPQYEGFLKQLDDERAAFIDTWDVDDELKAELKAKFDTLSEFRLVADGEAMKAAPDVKRNLKPGREYLDMVEGHRVFIGIMSAVNQNKIFNARLGYELANPALKERPEQLAQFRQMVENYKYPDTPLGRALTKGTFVYTMGLNFANLFQEMAQPAFSVMPQLMENGRGMLDSMKLIKSASGKATSFELKAAKLKRADADPHELWSQVVDGDEGKQLEALSREGALRGWLNYAVASELMEGNGIDEAIQMNDLAQKGRMRTAGEIATAPIRVFADTSAHVYGAFTQHNARVSMVSGWAEAQRNAKAKLAGLEQKMAATPNGPEKESLARQVALARRQSETWITDVKTGKKVLNPALLEATGEFIRETTFGGGRAGRPEILFSGKSPAWRTVGMAVNSLQSFTQGTLSGLARRVQLAYGKKSHPDLTPEQRKAARKALGYQLGLTMVASGALGMPFVAPIIAAIEENTDWEINKELRLGLDSILANDDGMLADIVMRGLVNAVAPADLSSRFSIGAPFGINPMDGWNSKAIFGPSMSIATNMLTGAKEAAGGNWGAALESFSPVAFKKIINMARNEGEVTDKSGTRLTNATMADRVAMAIGFTPEKVRRFRDAERLRMRNQQVTATKDQRFLDDMADAFMDDPTAVREALLAREKETEGRFVARAAAEKVATRIENKRFARDQYREVEARTAHTEEQILNAFRALPREDSESARLALRSQVKQQLGFGRAHTSHEMHRANQIDSLMGQGMSRTAALQAARHREQLFGL